MSPDGFNDKNIFVADYCAREFPFPPLPWIAIASSTSSSIIDPIDGDTDSSFGSRSLLPRAANEVSPSVSPAERAASAKIERSERSDAGCNERCNGELAEESALNFLRRWKYDKSRDSWMSRRERRYGDADTSSQQSRAPSRPLARRGPEKRVFISSDMRNGSMRNAGNFPRRRRRK